MGTEIQTTTQVLKVLATFLRDPDTELSGAEISKRAGLKSGTLYPILMRLENAKWLESEWEKGDPKVLGRPRRRFYTITALGARSARAELEELGSAFGTLAWTS